MRESLKFVLSDSFILKGIKRDAWIEKSQLIVEEVGRVVQRYCDCEREAGKKCGRLLLLWRAGASHMKGTRGLVELVNPKIRSIHPAFC